MKKMFHPLLSLMLLLLAAQWQTLYAQQSETEVRQNDNKIVIIKKHIDEDGNEIVEKIVKEGEDANIVIDMEDVDTDIDMDMDFDINIDDTDGEQHIRLRYSNSDGESDVIEWRGTGDLPDDIREKMEDLGLEMESELGENNHRYHFNQHGGKAFLGVVVGSKVEVNNDGEKVDLNATSNGLLIEEVVSGSAAEAAGLKEGDVITAIDGEAMNSYNDLTKAIRSHQAGDQIQINYLRDDQASSTTATLKTRARNKRSGFNWNRNFNDWANRPCVFIGVYVNNSNDANNEKGAYITGIIDDTPASQSGLAKGDVITALNGAAVNSYNDLLEERNKYNPGDEVSLSYTRDGQAQTTNITFRECEEKGNSFMDWFNEEGENFQFNFDDDFIFKSDDSKEKIIIIKRGKGTAEAEEEAPINTAPESDLPIQLQALQLGEFQAFPNPSDGQINVNFTADAVPTVVRITDISGKEVYRAVINDFNGNYNERIDVSDAANGTLFLSISQDKKVFTKKIILSRA